jgi:DNA-binding HxlR family transcriptional regulator
LTAPFEVIQSELSVKDELIEALGSVSRMKILLALARDPEKPWRLYTLQKITSINRELLKENLSRLVACNWIQVQQEVGAKRYRINLSNARAKSFVEFLQSTDYLSEV